MTEDRGVGSLGGPLFVFKGIKSILAKNRRYATAVFVYLYMYICIYIYRTVKEREREGKRKRE